MKIKTEPFNMVIEDLVKVLHDGGEPVEVIGYDTDEKQWTKNTIIAVEQYDKLPHKMIGLNTGIDVILPNDVSVLLHNKKWCRVDELDYISTLQAHSEKTPDTFVRTSFVVDAVAQDFTNIITDNTANYTLACGIVVQSLPKK
jgi:hypothetical protein